MYIQNILGVNFDKLPIDTAWNFGDNVEAKIHRIHSYPAKFPAFITTKALEYAKQKGIYVDTIADTFCGCGTTAFEARKEQKNFWGCDINPVATLIAKVKSKIYKTKKLLMYYQAIKNNFTNDSKVEELRLNEINERIKYWFNENQIIDLQKLKRAILDTVSSKSTYRDFFLCAFSNILKSTSNWLTKSIKPHFDPHKTPKSVESAFDKQFKFMLQANEENEISNKSKITIENKNFLNLNFKEPIADLVVTSPPYVTSYEYADLHQLSSLWLDYTNDYRKLRQGSIGSIYNNSEISNDISNLNETGKSICNDLSKVDKGKTKAVIKYFVDMAKSVVKINNILNTNGMVLFVIGNTEYKGIKIDNAKYIVHCMLDEGFFDIDVIHRKISSKILPSYRDRNGKFTSDLKGRKVYSEEFIVIGRKR